MTDYSWEYADNMINYASCIESPKKCIAAINNGEGNDNDCYLCEWGY